MAADCLCHPQGPVLGQILSNDLDSGIGVHGWNVLSGSLWLMLNWGWGVDDALEGRAAHQREAGEMSC